MTSLSLWEQILSFKRSSHYEKGRNWGESLRDPVVSIWCAYPLQRSGYAIEVSRVLSWIIIWLGKMMGFFSFFILFLQKISAEPVLSRDSLCRMGQKNGPV